MVAGPCRRRCAAHDPSRGRHLRRDAELDRSRQTAEGAAPALSTERSGQAISDAVVDDIVAVLPPLLQSLEALGFIARHLHPPAFGQVMQAAGEPDEALKAVRGRLAEWPELFSSVRVPLEAASDAALAA